MLRICVGIWFAVSAALVPIGAAQAQFLRDTASVAAPTTGIVAPDDARAVAVNPSAVAFVPHAGMVYAGLTASPSWVGGHGLYASAPLPFGLAFGAGLEARNLTTIGNDFVGTLALAMQASPYFSFGTGLRFLDSRGGVLDGAVSLDLAATFRPATFLSLTLLARDLNAPGYNNPLLGTVPRSFVLGAGLRPFGNTVTLEAAAAIDGDGRMGATGSLLVPVPYVGSVFARAELDRISESDHRTVVSAGLQLNWGNISAGGGVLVSDIQGSEPGAFGVARVEGGRRNGIPTSRYVLDLELRGGSASAFIQTVRALDRAIHDDAVAGVLLRPRGSGLGLATAQEIRMLVRELQEHGKRVVCHLDDATGSEFYACAHADRVLIDPAGGVRLMGPSTNVILLGDTLANLGLRADFIRIGEYKSAPEQLSNHELSAPGLLADTELLDDSFSRLLTDLASDMSISREQAQALIDNGPYVTREALEHSVADSEADELSMSEELEQAFGGDFARRRTFPNGMESAWSEAGRIGVVVIDGDIVDGANVDIPFLDVHMTGGRTVARAIETLAADPSVRAIVLRIDSPGGSALASDQMWRAVARARERKPVIASLGSVAASGGYYVASAANEIWADPSTITGSIGVFFGKVDVAELASRVGVQVTNIRRGRRAGADSIWRPFTDDERSMLADKVREWYRIFLDRVSEGRNMTPYEVDQAGRGRVWSGDRAVSLRLVDHLGGLQSALARARVLADLPDACGVVVVPSRPQTLLDYVVGGSAQTSDAASVAAIFSALPSEVRSAIASALSLHYSGGMAAQARMPYSIDLH